MGKSTICKGKNKGADQLRGNREADQRLCFCYSDSSIPLLLKSEVSSFWLFSVLLQTGLCQTCSETTHCWFSHEAAHLLSQQWIFAIVKNKYAVTTQPISIFIFATRIVQSLFFIYLKFQASSLLLGLQRLVCVRSGWKPQRHVFL